MNEYDAILTGQAVPVNEYDELIQGDRSANMSNVNAAARKDIQPDAAAQVINISDRTKLPRTTIERNAKAIERTMNRNEYDDIVQNPVLAKWLSDPYNQAAVKDDPLFTRLDRFYNSIARSWQNFGAARSMSSAVEKQQYLDQFDFVEAQLAAGKRPQDIDPTKDPFNFRLIPTPEGRTKFRESITNMRNVSLEDVEVRSKVIAAIPSVSPSVAAAISSKSAGEFFHHFTSDGIGGMVEFITTVGAESSIQSAATALAVMGSGGSRGASALVSGGMSYGMEFGSSLTKYMGDAGVNLKDRGSVQAFLSDKTKLKKAIDFAEGRAGPVAVFDAIAGGSAAAVRTLRGAAGNMALQGVLGAAGEASASLNVGEELKFGEIAAEFLGEFVTAPIEFGSQVPQMVQARRNRLIAAEQQNFFKAIGSLSEKVKLQQRLPEKMQEIVNDLTADGPIENVYIDPRAFVQYFQSKNIDPRNVAREVLGSEQALDEALASNTDLQIPTGNYAAKIAGTEHNAELSKDLKFDPTALSVRESERALKMAMEEAQAKAKEAQAQTGTEQTVTQIVSEALQKQGFDPKAADALARQMEAFFSTQAARTGEKGGAMSMFKEYALRIIGRGDQLKGREAMTAEQSAWHGSPHIFSKFSTEYLGTGEGQQVHGWGLYFAKLKETSQMTLR